MGCQFASDPAANLLHLDLRGLVSAHVVDTHGNALEPSPWGRDGVKFLVGNNEGPYTATITIDGPGPVTVAVESWDPRSSTLGKTPERPLRRSLFAVSGAAGDIMHITYATNDNPAKRILTVDRGGDGSIDDTFLPAASDNGSSMAYSEQPLVMAEIMTGAAETVMVGFVPNRVPERLPDAEAIYYAIYPDAPWMQIYSEPFAVPRGSLVRYNAWDTTGNQGSGMSIFIPDASRALPFSVLSNNPRQYGVAFEAGAHHQLYDLTHVVDQNLTIEISGDCGLFVTLVDHDGQTLGTDVLRASTWMLRPDYDLASPSMLIMTSYLETDCYSSIRVYRS